MPAKTKPKRLTRPRVALVFFNSISEESEFWGNTEMSGISGSLNGLNVENDMFVVFMKITDNETKNYKTIKKLIETLNDGKYDIAIFHSYWLPGIRDMLISGLKTDLVSMESHEEFKNICKKFPVIRTALDIKNWGHMSLFKPNFNYQLIGNDKPVRQTIVDITSHGCAYSKNLIGNPFYERWSLEKKRLFRGCAYCSNSVYRKGFNIDKEAKVYATQIEYFLRNLPHLEKIQLNYTWGYFSILKNALRLMKMEPVRDLRHVKFFFQMRPDVIVNQKEDIRSLLEEMENTPFSFYPAVVGFENFSQKELDILNRGYCPDVIPKAIFVLGRFAKTYRDSFTMENSVASFILFNPWTGRSDIGLNIREIGKNDFSFFSDINLNRIKINPTTAMYHMAEKQSLIIQKGKTMSITDLPSGGFLGDYHYKFLDPRVGHVYKLYRRMLPNLKKEQKIDALEAILENVVIDT